jgi:hypothetical protein
VADDRDLFDVFEFQRAATGLLGADVTLYSDGALRNAHVSLDLVTATPLWAPISAPTATLLELDALLEEIASLRSEGDATRFASDSRYRWVLHRLWIAAGNEALAHSTAIGHPVRADRTWANVYDLRNHLAHSRLPDIDEGLVRRFTWSRLGRLREAVKRHLRAR